MKLGGLKGGSETGYGPGGDAGRGRPSPGEPDTWKLVSPVRRGGSGNLQVAGGSVVRHPDGKQGARPLPSALEDSAGPHTPGRLADGLTARPPAPRAVGVSRGR